MKPVKLTRRRFLHFGSVGAVGAIATSVCLGETLHVVVERVEVNLARLPGQLDGLKIAHLSDFHYGSHRDAHVIRTAVRVTNELDPDLIVLTGDYVTFPASGTSDLGALGAILCAQILGDLHAPMGIYAVLGNHDQCDAHFVTQSLERNGITVMGNFACRAERSGGRLWIAGVEDILGAAPNLSKSLSAIPNGEATLLLVHEPDFADEVIRYPVDLQLSGHSHGGQVRMPFLGAPYLPQLARKYPYGLHQLGPLSLYTTRGIGTTYLPIRFDCPPEVSLLTLRSAGALPNPARRQEPLRRVADQPFC